MRLAAAFAVVISVLSLVPRLAAAGAWVLNPGEYYSELEASRYSADTFYSPDGGRQELAFGGVFEERRLQSYNELGWKNRMSVSFAAPAQSVTRRIATPFIASQTQTGLGDVDLGLRYRIKGHEPATSLEVGFTAPLGYTTQTAAPLGDGLYELRAVLAVGGTFKDRGWLEASGGYATRFLEGLFQSQKDSTTTNDQGQTVHNPDYVALHEQKQVLLSADAGFWLGPSLLIAGRYQARLTTSHGDASPDADEHLVGPELRYRLDDRMDMIAGSQHTMAGKNVLHRDRFYVGFAFRTTKLNRLQGFLGNKQRP